MRHSHIAWFAALTHVIAALGMLLLLKGGLPGAPARLEYIASHRAAWIGGWLLWHLAAISLMALYAVLALRFRDALSVTALMVAAAGLSLDIASETRYMTSDALDRQLEVLIGYGANGLYTVAFVLLVIAGWRVMPRAANALAVPVAISGFALAIASLQHDARLETITSAILFPLFTLWIVIIALWLRKEESS